MAKLHQNKEISEAIRYALSNGFRIIEAGTRSHAALILYCPLAERAGCKKSIYSTPRNPTAHANDIRSFVDDCEHKAAAGPAAGGGQPP